MGSFNGSLPGSRHGLRRADERENAIQRRRGENGKRLTACARGPGERASEVPGGVDQFRLAEGPSRSGSDPPFSFVNGRACSRGGALDSKVKEGRQGYWHKPQL